MARAFLACVSFRPSTSPFPPFRALPPCYTLAPQSDPLRRLSSFSSSSSSSSSSIRTCRYIYIYICIIRAEQTSRSQTLSPQRGGYYLARTRIYERREGVGFVQPADRLSSTTDAAIVRCKYGIIPESPKDERDILFLVAISFTNRSVERSVLQFRTNKIIASDRKISSHLTISWPEIVVKRE